MVCFDSYHKSLQNLWISQRVHFLQLRSTLKPDEPKFRPGTFTADKVGTSTEGIPVAPMWVLVQFVPMAELYP